MVLSVSLQAGVLESAAWLEPQRQIFGRASGGREEQGGEVGLKPGLRRAPGSEGRRQQVRDQSVLHPIRAGRARLTGAAPLQPFLGCVLDVHSHPQWMLLTLARPTERSTYI